MDSFLGAGQPAVEVAGEVLMPFTVCGWLIRTLAGAALLELKMAETDIFPVDPDYTVSRSREPNVLVSRVESGEEFRRTRAPLRRVFDLGFQERPYADWTLIENFRLTHRETHFTFVDKSQGNRDFSCYFLGEPQYDEVGNEQVNIRLQLIEAVNQNLRNYPQTPLHTLPSSKITSASDGKVAVYPGYGFKIAGSFITDVEVDGVSVGNTLQKFDLPLALHTLKAKPAAAVISTFQFVH